eukprot:2871642-Rhodomonas_salina.3
MAPAEHTRRHNADWGLDRRTRTRTRWRGCRSRSRCPCPAPGCCPAPTVSSRRGEVGSGRGGEGFDVDQQQTVLICSIQATKISPYLVAV